MSYRSLSFLLLSFAMSIDARSSFSFDEIDLGNIFPQNAPVMLLEEDQLKNLFPQQFDAQQIIGFCKDKKSEKTGSAYLVGSDFYATTPYSFQFITGTYEKFSQNISFKGGVSTKNGNIVGKYTFKSPYTSWNNSEFEVTLDLSPLKFFNMNESVLGDKDFISSPSQLSTPGLIKNSSFFYIANTDENFVRQTTHGMHRLNENAKSWLLILAHLGGEKIYEMSDEERNKKGDELYAEYLRNMNYELSSDGVLTNEEYVKINTDLRTKILGHFGIKIENIPSLEMISDPCKLADGKLFFAVAATSAVF